MNNSLESGKLPSLKYENFQNHQQQSNLFESETSVNELNLSNPFHETFANVWKQYIKLLALNGRFLFSDIDKSKEKFCQLLHSQIDISNKLFLMVSQTDDRKFLEYSNFMVQSVNFANPLFGFPAEGTQELSNLSNAFNLIPNQKKFNKPGDSKLTSLNPSENVRFGTREKETFLIPDVTFKNNLSHYAAIKNYLFDDQLNSKIELSVPNSVSGFSSYKSQEKGNEFLDLSNNVYFDSPSKPMALFMNSFDITASMMDKKQ